MSNLVLRNKALILGNATVGKSAILQRFLSDGNSFPKTYSATMTPEIQVKVISIPDSNVSVELYLHDTSGSDNLLETMSDGVSSVILVYDVTCLESFKAITKWLEISSSLLSNKGSVMGVLVANKIDLENRRVVSTSQGQDLAKLNGFGYFEVSAFSNLEVESPFYYLSNIYHENFEENIKSFKKLSSSVAQV